MIGHTADDHLAAQCVAATCTQTNTKKLQVLYDTFECDIPGTILGSWSHSKVKLRVIIV